MSSLPINFRNKGKVAQHLGELSHSPLEILIEECLWKKLNKSRNLGSSGFCSLGSVSLSLFASVCLSHSLMNSGPLAPKQMLL